MRKATLFVLLAVIFSIFGIYTTIQEIYIGGFNSNHFLALTIYSLVGVALFSAKAG